MSGIVKATLASSRPIVAVEPSMEFVAARNPHENLGASLNHTHGKSTFIVDRAF